MSEAQQPQREDPCDTCLNDDCCFNKERCESTWHNDIYYFMRKRGCASHSNTRQYPPPPVAERTYLISESELIRAHTGLAFKSYLYEGDAAIARAATLKSREETLLDVISLLDIRTAAYTKVNLMLAKCRLDQRQQAGEQE